MTHDTTDHSFFSVQNKETMSSVDMTSIVKIQVVLFFTDSFVLGVYYCCLFLWKESLVILYYLYVKRWCRFVKFNFLNNVRAFFFTLTVT